MSVTLEIPEDVLSTIPGSTIEVQERLRLELTRRGIARHYGEEEMADDAAYVAGHQ